MGRRSTSQRTMKVLIDLADAYRGLPRSISLRMTVLDAQVRVTI